MIGKNLFLLLNLKAGGRLIHSITSGEFRMITANGDATIYSSAVDLSPFLTNKIVITDNNGNQAVAWGYQADLAESTTELVTNGDNETAMASFDEDSARRCIATQDNGQAHGGTYSMKLTQNYGSDSKCSYNFEDTDESLVKLGSLFKIRTWVYIPSGQDGNRGFWYFDIGIDFLGSYTTTTDSWVELETNYITSVSENRVYIQLAPNTTSDGDIIYADDISILRVDSLGTTALQLRSTPSGSTRNLASKDAGFDPNNIAKIEVFGA